MNNMNNMFSSSPYVNSTGSNDPMFFGTNQTSLEYGLPNPYRGNVAAADASKMVGGSRGGKKQIRRKIKNIMNKYRVSMSTKKRNLSKLRRKYGYTKKRRTSRRNRKTVRGLRQRGGYTQWMSDTPICTGYSAAGMNLGSSNLGLANPVPITAYPQQNWIR